MWKWQTQSKNREGGGACYCLLISWKIFVQSVLRLRGDGCGVAQAWIKELFDGIFSTLRNEKTFQERWMFSRDVQKNVWVTEWGKWGTNSWHLPFIYITVCMKETMRSVKKAEKMLKSLLQHALTELLFSKLRWTCSKLKYNDAPILTYGWPLHFGWKKRFY